MKESKGAEQDVQNMVKEPIIFVGIGIENLKTL